MKPFLRAATLAALLGVVVACGKKDATGVDVPVAGTWTGGVAITNGRLGWSMTLTEVADSISGNGSATGSGGSFGGSGSVMMTVSGMQNGSSVTLAFNSPGFITAIYTATLTSVDEMDGVLNGSGFTNAKMTLLKS